MLHHYSTSLLADQISTTLYISGLWISSLFWSLASRRTHFDVKNSFKEARFRIVFRKRYLKICNKIYKSHLKTTIQKGSCVCKLFGLHNYSFYEEKLKVLQVSKFFIRPNQCHCIGEAHLNFSTTGVTLTTLKRTNKIKLY